MTWEQQYDLLRDVLGVSQDALDMAFGIWGCNTKTAESILYYYTGWHSFEGWLSEDGDD